jgi:hypothetical protein
MRRAIASAALAGFLAFGGLFPIALRAQVVIRERIEVGAEVVRPDSTVASAAAPFVPLDGPISGYQVFYARVGQYAPRAVTEGHPHELEGTITVTESASGLVYSAGIADGFEVGTIASTAQCHANGAYSIWWEDYEPTAIPGSVVYRQRRYTPLTEVELLRVPTRAGHTYAGTLQIRNSTIAINGSTFGTTFGCQQINQFTPFCGCYGNTSQTFKHVAAYFRRVILPPPPPDHFTVAAAPDTVEAGGTSALTVVARDSLGSEVTFTATTPVTLTLSDASWGQLAYGSTSGASVTAPYSAARAGAVSFVADSTTYCGLSTIEINAAGGGIAGSGVVVVDGGSASAFVGCEPCTRDECQPGVEGPQRFDPEASVRVREVGQVLTWGDTESLTVQQLPIPLPGPRPATPAGYTGPQFMLSDPIGGDSLNVSAGPHLRHDICLNNGRWVARINGMVVPVIPEEFISRYDSLRVSDATYPLVDLRDLTEAHFRSLLANGSITRSDSIWLMIDLEYGRIGPYALRFHRRVFELTPDDPEYIDTTDANWGPVYHGLVRPVLSDIVRSDSLVASLDGVNARRAFYLSSTGAMVHERDHVPHVVDDLVDAMNGWLTRADTLINGRFAPECAEEVVAWLRSWADHDVVGMQSAYFDHLEERGRLEPHTYMRMELEGDVAARPSFQLMRRNVAGTYIPNAILDGLW